MADEADHLERIRAQFTRQAETYVATGQTADERGHAALAALTGASGNEHALDVACGPGFLTLALAARAADAVGVDATPVFVERARAEAARRGVANASFRLGDANALPFEDASFDVVTCRAAFHHFPDPSAVLAEMRRVLRPGGRALVADFLASEDPERAARHNEVERLCDPTHVRALSESEFDALFESAGFGVRARPKSELHYDAHEWIDHGGPDARTRAEILARLEASLEADRLGLAVYRSEGRLRFRHVGAAFLLVRDGVS